jgi:uncharacterized phosphosugar-binding protein
MQISQKKADYLSATSSVLSGTTSNQLGITMLEQFFVEAHVLLFGKDSIVGFESILLEEGVVTIAVVSWALGPMPTN